jgi:hypothetical protein
LPGTRLPRLRLLLPALPGRTPPLTTTEARAQESVSITASFSDDEPGPAGTGLQLGGSSTRLTAQLEQKGPRACPGDSHAGVGGGEGVYEIGREAIEESLTSLSTVPCPGKH